MGGSPGAFSVERLVALVEPLRAHAADSLLAFDYDGTLSPVVDDPAAAQLVDGVAALLQELSQDYAGVAVLSGRPVSFLARHLPGSTALSGLYGLESLIDGVVIDHPEADAWRPVVHDAVRLAAEAAEPGGPLDGMTVEGKGLSLTLHVRTRPDLEAAVVVFARSLAADLGLEARAAKRSVELHPPIAADKGTALAQLVVQTGATRVLFVGDDLGDVAAFDALGRLAAEGTVVASVAVAVGGPELPDEVHRRANLVLGGPHEVVDLLRALRP